MNRLTPLAGLLLVAGLAQASTLTRTTAWTYDSDGFLVQETTEPDNAALRIDTRYTLDAFGNRTQTTVSSTASGAAAVAARTSNASYDASGRFPVSQSNALGHAETRQYDARFGTVSSLTGPNGLSTNWSYDGFGRKEKEVRADGTQTRWAYTLCNGGCAGNGLVNAFYYLTETPLDANGAQNGAVTKVYYDSLEREIRREVQGFDGTPIVTLTQYDNLGRVSQGSRPYYSGQAVYWTQTSYDVLDRKTSETAPDNSITRYAYNGVTASSTNANNQTTSKVRNSRDEVISITDANGKTLQMAYDPFGNLLQTTDPAGNQIKNTFDLLGRKLTTVDPDMGSWSYQYDGFGQLIVQTDAKGQVSRYQYDKLGRMTQRAESDLTSTWTFDSCSKGVGKLCQSTSDNGYSQTLAYDSLGRAAGNTTVLDTSYTASNGYDANGRLASQTYPTGVQAKYVYNSYGYLAEVRNGASNALYWQANTLDAAGNLLLQTFGNGLPVQQSFDPRTGRQTAVTAGAGNSVLNLSYQYDSLGNLMNRTDANLNVNETFLYDKLNRLTASQGAGLPSLTFAYDDMGNIVNRSDVGSYTYGTSRPHAVASIAGTVNASFVYDANGNQTSGNGRTIGYASYNLPISITKGGQTDQFLYGPDHQRIKQTSTATGTTWYLNPDNAGGLLFEKQVKPDGSTENHHYLNAAGQTFALLTTKGDGSSAVRYWHKDQLGSLVAVTDEAGTVVERLSYEAFGKRRYPNGQQDPNGTLSGQTTERGYTGHEHLDEVGLIHMNGRVYDPLIARFVVADPTVPNPEWLQSYNRYSYVLNNPFAYTDPTGFDVEGNNDVAGDPDSEADDSYTGKYAGKEYDTDSWVSDDGTVHVVARDTPPDPVDRGGHHGGPSILGGGSGAPSIGQRGASLAADLVPGVSTAKAATELWSGVDPITGEAVPAGWATIGLVASLVDMKGAVTALREGLKAAKAARSLSVDVAKGIPEGLSGLADPSNIRFTQSSVSATFKDGRSIQDTIDALRSGALLPKDLPAIRVFEKNGLIYTLDNRRLFVSGQAGVRVNITPATAQDLARESWKFTTPNSGCIVCVKGGSVQ